MNTSEDLSNDIDTYLPKLNKSQLISVLTLLVFSNNGKPDVISNKCKLMRWIQKGYEEIMRDEERDSEGKGKYLQDLFNFITSFTDRNGEYRKDPERHDQEGKTLQQ